jgi:hypothetical protein
MQRHHDRTSPRASLTLSTWSSANLPAASFIVAASGAIAPAASRSVIAPIVTWTAPHEHRSTTAKSPAAKIRREQVVIVIFDN